MSELRPVSVWDAGFEAGVDNVYNNPEYQSIAMRRLWQHGWMAARKIQALFEKGKVSEHTHQVAVVRWAEVAKAFRPELELLYSTPNGGLRAKLVAAKLKAEGVRAGVPDLALNVPMHGSHGLFIEMKMPKGTVSDEQKWWIEKLESYGNTAVVCRGWHQARKAITNYLDGV